MGQQVECHQHSLAKFMYRSVNIATAYFLLFIDAFTSDNDLVADGDDQLVDQDADQIQG